MWKKKNEVFLKKKCPKVCRFRKKQYLCTRIQGNASHTENNAAIAQLVERDLAKVEVAGPSPVCRSSF